MVNQVIDGVVRAICAEFPQYPVYTDEVEQGLKEPCFSVSVIRPRQEQKLGMQFFRQCPVCVIFFPPSGAEKSLTNQVIEKLFSILTVIPGAFRGSNMDAHVEDEVLLFRVDYNFFVRFVDEESETMNDLKVREFVNEKG